MPMKIEEIKSMGGMQCFALPITALILTAMAIARPGQADGTRDEGAAEIANAVEVAKDWFTSLVRGETAVTASLSAVPFSFDGKHEIATLAELKGFYDGIVEKKGKRDILVASAKIESSSPEKIVVLITIEGSDETVSIFIKPGDAFRVVGFRD